MALDREWQTFEEALPRLLQDEANRGKFALVHGASIDSLWPTEEAALSAGYKRFALEPFLVQEITDRKEPKYFSHNTTRCQ